MHSKQVSFSTMEKHLCNYCLENESKSHIRSFEINDLDLISIVTCQGTHMKFAPCRVASAIYYLSNTCRVAANSNKKENLMNLMSELAIHYNKIHNIYTNICDEL